MVYKLFDKVEHNLSWAQDRLDSRDVHTLHVCQIVYTPITLKVCHSGKCPVEVLLCTVENQRIPRTRMRECFDSHERLRRRREVALQGIRSRVLYPLGGVKTCSDLLSHTSRTPSPPGFLRTHIKSMVFSNSVCLKTRCSRSTTDVPLFSYVRTRLCDDNKKM